jgi:hypothetical protein
MPQLPQCCGEPLMSTQAPPQLVCRPHKCPRSSVGANLVARADNAAVTATLGIARDVHTLSATDLVGVAAR